MSKVGKLSVISSNHITLGPIVEVEIPVECTNLEEALDAVEVTVAQTYDDTVTIRLTYDTASRLATALNKLVADHAKAVEESYCGAV